MASTYSSNIAIELITEGEQAGAWGTTTNGNWKRVEESTSLYAQVVVNEVTFNWTLSDTEAPYVASSASTTGSTGRAAFVEFVSEASGDPSSAPTVNIRGNGTSDYPNRVFFAKNSLHADDAFDITFDCGSGADFVLKHGCVAAIYTADTESAGLVGNIFSNLQVGGLVLEEDGVIVFETTDDDAFETTLIAADAGGSDRTLTLPAATTQLVGRSTVDTLTNKTLTTPTIGNFTNATHTHANAAGGGQITLGTGTTGNYVSTAVAGSGIDVSSATGDVTVSIGSGEVTDAMLNDDVATGLAGAGTTATSGVINVIGGSGITANANDIAVTPAQTTITSVLNTSLVMGRDADNDIDFGTDNTIRFRVGNEDQLTLTDGFLTPSVNNIVDLGTDALEFKDAWFDGTVTSDAFAGPLTGNVTGNCSGTAATVTAGTQASITAASNLVTVGALDSGSITSGFGSIDVGSSAIDGGVVTADTNFAGNLVGASATSSSGSFTVDATAGQLILNSGSNSDITLTPAGTGSVDIAGPFNLNGSTCYSESLSADGAAGRCILVGPNAGDSLTSGSPGGTIAIGDGAGTKIEAGHSTIAIGQSACGETVDTSGNIGIGRESCGGTGGGTTNALNVGVGYQALTAVTGGQNTALGTYAGNSITSGTYNVALGTSAGIGITTGSTNICVGYIAGENIGTGSNNVLIGESAGEAIVDENQNTMIGTGAGRFITDGPNNVCIGYLTGQDLTSGCQHNTMVGTAVAGLGSDTTDSQFNTFIGYDLDFSASGVDYAIQIGTQITGGDGGEDTVRIGRGSNAIEADFADFSSGWAAVSDVRIKKNINDIGIGLDFINDLNPVEYEYRQSEDIDESDSDLIREAILDNNGQSIKKPGKHYGFIAQEVKASAESYLSEGYLGWSEGPEGLQRVGQSGFITPLVKAVQELSEKVVSLEARLAAVE